MAGNKRVLAFGTFDLLHPGHLHYLKEAKARGDELVVIVARDANAEKARGKPPVFDEAHRLELVSSLKFVDRAVLGDEAELMKPLLELRPEVIALGYDQEADEKQLQAELGAAGLKAEIVRISAFRPERHKSSNLRARFGLG